MPKVQVVLHIDPSLLDMVDRRVGLGRRSAFARESMKVMLWLGERWPECQTAERAIARLAKELGATE